LQSLPSDDNPYQEMCRYSNQIVEFNSMVWNKKKQTVSNETGKILSLRDSIYIEIPSELQIFKGDLINMHNLKSKL
jgi:valyl-tRNA synthetase